PETYAAFFKEVCRRTGVLLAFIYQLSWIAVNIVVTLALVIDVPWSFIALMVPISDIVGLLPIFFNNLGAREGIYTLLLGLLGVAAAQALALALLVFGLRLVVSLLGGVVLLLESAAAVKLRVKS
ncbi:MAG: lysylphosphatidylglycerol synthase domain-containing protein, partial [Roseiflexaceae bacterium]